MSWDACSATMRLPDHVGPPHRLVLIAIANNADTNGQAYPGLELLAARTSYAVSHVRRLVATLCEPMDGHAPLLRRDVNAAPDDRIPEDRKPNLYTLLYLDGCTCGEALRPDDKVASVRARTRERPSLPIGRARMSERARTHARNGRSRVRAKSLEEPSEEPSELRADARDDGDSRKAKGKSATKSKVKNDRAKSNGSFDAEFAAWWAGYPKKENRGAAAERFRARRRAGVTVERLTAARDAYASLVAAEGREPRYMLNGATFLGPEGRWSELAAPADPQPESTPQTGTQSVSEPLGPEARAARAMVWWLDWRQKRVALSSGTLTVEATAKAAAAFRWALEAGHDSLDIGRAMQALVEAHIAEWGSTGVTHIGPDRDALAAFLAETPHPAPSEHPGDL